MGALRYRFRAGARAHWRSWLVRGVLFGVAAAAVLSTSLTAQRTDSAALRFATAKNTFDVYIPNADDPGIATFDPADVAALPNVVDTAVAGLTYIGVLAVLLVTPLVGLSAAIRAAPRGASVIGAHRGTAGSTRVSAVASGSAAIGAPPPVVLGARLALEAAGAEDAVPVRSTVLAVTMSVLMATAALTIGASLDHLLHPARSAARTSVAGSLKDA